MCIRRTSEQYPFFFIRRLAQVLLHLCYLVRVITVRTPFVLRSAGFSDVALPAYSPSPFTLSTTFPSQVLASVSALPHRPRRLTSRVDTSLLDARRDSSQVSVPLSLFSASLTPLPSYRIDNAPASRSLDPSALSHLSSYRTSYESGQLPASPRLPVITAQCDTSARPLIACIPPPRRPLAPLPFIVSKTSTVYKL